MYLYQTDNMECIFQQQRPVGVFRQPAPQPPGRFGGGQQHTLLPQPKAPQVRGLWFSLCLFVAGVAILEFWGGETTWRL